MLMELPSAAVKDTFPVSRQISLPESIQRLLNVPAKEDAVASIVGNVLEGNEQLGVLSQVSAAEISTYMQNILLRDTDQMSMASALEVREPFFDYKLVEYVLGIPDELKYPTYPKSLLVESLKPMLPDEIVHRPKMGFTLPWKNWLHTELRGWCTARLASIADRPEFDGDAVREIKRAFFDKPESKEWMPVFQLAVLEDWLAKNLHS